MAYGYWSMVIGQWDFHGEGEIIKCKAIGFSRKNAQKTQNMTVMNFSRGGIGTRRWKL